MGKSDKNVKVNLKYALYVGGISFVIILVGSGLIGGLSGADPLALVRTTLPNIKSLCGTFILALGTILALMLTLLNFSTDLKVDLKWSYYLRVKQISLIITVTLIAAVIVYLLLNIPVVEADIVVNQWYMAIYYICIGLGALLGGAFVTVILYLYGTISEVIEIFAPDRPDIISMEEE